MSGENWLPGGGIGLRFRLADKTPLNYRIDYAWDKNDSFLYFSVGESF